MADPGDEGNRISRQLNVSVPGAAPGAAVPPAPWGRAAGQGAAAASGLASWARAADAAAAELQRRAADLTAAARAAAGRQYQARSADGSVTVTADGRPRVVSIRVVGQAASSAPGRLARTLTDTVNSALEDARHSTQALLGRADPALQALIDETADAPGGAGRSPAAAARAEAAARVTTATSADDSVTATVSAPATVVSIELSQDTSRGDGPARLGDAVAQAVNAALAAAEQAARQLAARAPFPAPDPWSAGKASLDALANRMSPLLGELDRIGRDLDR